MIQVLAPGTKIGPYEIQALIGHGGMGVVYRARDPKLQRDVALKLLPDVFASDAERLTRFEREARTLAALNDPNIAHVYGFEHAGGTYALVMELVEGEDLAQRIAHGPISMDEALSIARQIAKALEAAHEAGIIHRDLKPPNIKLRPDGVVKVLDFGIAKSIAPHAASEGVTVTANETREGVVIGTAAYMSPEQARGLSVDRRTDIWAFGCVLYEMLTGRAAFAGATSSDTIATVLQRAPDWTVLPPDVPASVRRLLQRCLEKDVKRRLRDIGDAGPDIEPDIDLVAPSVTTARGNALSLAWITAGIAAALAALGWWTAVTQAPAESDTSGYTLARITWDGELAIEPTLSPDGTLIVYASNAGAQGNLDLWVQRVAGGPAARLTQDVADDHAPHFSPDGTAIAFRSERAGGGIYVMPSLGGDARLIAPGGRDPQFRQTARASRTGPAGFSVARGRTAGRFTYRRPMAEPLDSFHQTSRPRDGRYGHPTVARLCSSAAAVTRRPRRHQW